jgi:hypothetical protein
MASFDAESYAVESEDAREAFGDAVECEEWHGRMIKN